MLQGLVHKFQAPALLRKLLSPLLFEAGFEDGFDVTVAVVTDDRLRKSRFPKDLPLFEQRSQVIDPLVIQNTKVLF